MLKGELNEQSIHHIQWESAVDTWNISDLDCRDRPHTCAMPEPRNPHLEATVRQMTSTQSSFYEPPKHPKILLRAQKMKIEILDTWGDTYYVGLCGVALTQTDGVYLQG